MRVNILSNINRMSKGSRANSVRWLGVTLLLSLFTSQAMAFSLDDVAKQLKGSMGKTTAESLKIVDGLNPSKAIEGLKGLLNTK